MSLFVERFINGLADGSIYALLALALVVVFRSTGQLNFAQGEIGTLGAFVVSTLTLSGLSVWARKVTERIPVYHGRTQTCSLT